MAKKFKSGRRSGNGVSFWGGLSLTLTVLSALVLILSYSSLFIKPSSVWLPMFCGLYYIPIFLFNLLLLLISALRRKKRSLITLVALLPSLFFADIFVKVGKEDQVHLVEGHKILSYNVGRFRMGEKGMKMEENCAKILNFIAMEDPDIVCLQEFAIKDSDKLARMFSAYPYRHYYFFKGKRQSGNLTLSKYPITGRTRITFKSSTNLCICSDIQVGAHAIRVYNCHLESYAISFTSLIKRMGSAVEGLREEFMDLHVKLRGTNVKRCIQVDDVIADIRSSDVPAFVCGDFNDPPMSYTYHKLSQGRKDSFSEGGSGFSATYSTLWPLLTIDYILVPDNCSVDGHNIKRIKYSDHYPISSYFYFEE